LEDVFECIDEALQERKEIVFQTSVEPITWVKPSWSTQIQHPLQCYNVTTEEFDENPSNINILE